jgi:hypothetical protein
MVPLEKAILKVWLLASSNMIFHPNISSWWEWITTLEHVVTLFNNGCGKKNNRFQAYIPHTAPNLVLQKIPLSLTGPLIQNVFNFQIVHKSSEVDTSSNKTKQLPPVHPVYKQPVLSSMPIGWTLLSPIHQSNEALLLATSFQPAGEIDEEGPVSNSMDHPDLLDTGSCSPTQRNGPCCCWDKPIRQKNLCCCWCPSAWDFVTRPW